MTSAACSGTSEDNLPQLDFIDEMNKKWKQEDAEVTAACSGGQGATIHPVAEQYEATPDIEVFINIHYLDGTSKYLEGNLNPLRLINELLVRLAPQLDLTPQTVTMSWSKKLNDGTQAQPVIMDRTRNLRSYRVETDDTIILRENREADIDNTVESP